MDLGWREVCPDLRKRIQSGQSSFSPELGIDKNPEGCMLGSMECVSAGHVYQTTNVDGCGHQEIVFVRRRDGTGEPLPNRSRESGILSQELLRVLIDRTLYLNAEVPCGEDTAIVGHLRAALCLYESRAARRSIERLTKPELAPVCAICGHILCRCADGH